MAREHDGFLNPAESSVLSGLADDPIIEQVWAAIEKSCGPQTRLTMRFLIRDMLFARRLAMNADDWPDYVLCATKAEELAGLFESSPFLRAFKDIADAVTMLESIAMRFRGLNASRRVHVSRQNVGISRQVILFVRLLSMEMVDLFRRPLDGSVAILTNIIFPAAHVTTDSVRAARRPTTRKSRTGKQ